MRRILFGLAALILVGVGLVFVLPLFISTADLQKKALAQVESATGYRVRIDGPVRMTFFPSLDLVASDVGIAQPAAGGPAEFATARTLKFGLMLSGLLHGKVQLTEATLVDPVITLPHAVAGEDSAAGPGAGRESPRTVACATSASTR